MREMRDSGVEWIGEIPKDWNCCKQKYRFKVNHIEVEIDKRNKLIKKYQEYKKSLIYEVVTGKKEV